MLNLFIKCSKEQKEEFSNEEETVDTGIEQPEVLEETFEEDTEETLSGGFTDEYYRLMEKKRIVDIYID
ncbi:hypothetical protein [Flammeovirga sp. OC4]|uniref:hypothetical protein n=1 Tax=Flammeovirga sp. OC4 TaxID=1382345 RepID=UPI0005C50AB9|nr:hypothetical protein [Flammeovirga sp. OC4]